MQIEHFAIVFHVLAVVIATWVICPFSQSNVYRKLTRADIFILAFVIGSLLLQLYSPIAAVITCILAALGKYSHSPDPRIEYFCKFLLLVGSLSVALHLVPGFFFTQVVSDREISTSAKPLNLWLSLDKAMVGIVLLVYLVREPWERLSPKSVVLSLCGAGSIILIAMILGISPEVKAGDYLLWFIPINLFITCLAEELFFRKLLQDNLARVLPKTPLGQVVVTAIVAYIFLLAHGIVVPSSTVAFLYLLASVLYAGVYQLYKRVELSILVHFSLNLMHILLLPYPL